MHVFFLLFDSFYQTFCLGCIKAARRLVESCDHCRQQTTNCKLYYSFSGSISTLSGYLWHIWQRSALNIEFLFNRHYRNPKFSSLLTSLERHLDLKEIQCMETFSMSSSNVVHCKRLLKESCFVACFCLLYRFSTVYERPNSIFW